MTIIEHCMDRIDSMRVSQAADLVRTVQIGAEIEKIGRAV